jgi:GNAT superfamily N-acetyltransferase
MSGVSLRRGLREGDLAALSALTATSPTAPLGPGRLEELLLAPGQEVRAVHVAEQDGVPVGYVHLAAEAVGAREAWIVSGAVAPQERGRGIGTMLLRAVLEEARALGARTVRVSGRPQGYAAPGVDAERDPGTARFLEARGARAGGPALAMHRTLHDLVPATIDTAGEPTAPRVRACTPEALPALLDLTSEHLAPDWAGTLARYAAEGGALERILLAEEPDGTPLGFACWGVVGRDPTRFGPFGVVPAARGRGAGAALLDGALRAMAAEGLAHAWFLWTAPDTPAHRLYLARGFTPLRTFTPYRIDLGDEHPGTTSPEGQAR